MPTDVELAEYAGKLPPIYRDILAAFPGAEPSRKAGYGLAFQTLTAYFANHDLKYDFGEVQEACHRLAGLGFLEIRNRIFAHPTELGERLIGAVSGKKATAPSVPELPRPAW